MDTENKTAETSWNINKLPGSTPAGGSYIILEVRQQMPGIYDRSQNVKKSF